MELLRPLTGENKGQPRTQVAPLTPRQLDVLKLLARGRTNPEIAQELVLSTGTVRTHVQHIIARLGVSDRTGAVVRAIELGLITPESDFQGSH
jgi:DNA-binding NarL/FixJ family response regulator